MDLSIIQYFIAFLFIDSYIFCLGHGKKGRRWVGDQRAIIKYSRSLILCDDILEKCWHNLDIHDLGMLFALLFAVFRRLRLSMAVSPAMCCVHRRAGRWRSRAGAGEWLDESQFTTFVTNVIEGWSQNVRPSSHN